MTPAGTIRAPHVFVGADAPDAMAITVNGATRLVRAGATLAGLVRSLGRAPESVATAVNGHFVPRGGREAVVLRAGDAVDCFEPIVGG